jgi:PAS domain-containing protein
MITGTDLLETLPVAVYTTDAEGRITFYNEAAAELWGPPSRARQQPMVRVVATVLARRPAAAP